MAISKQELLKKVQKPRELTAVMKDFVPFMLKGRSAYNLLTAVDVNDGGLVSVSALDRTLKTTYSLWHDYVTRKNPNLYNGQTARVIKLLKVDPKLSPSNMTAEECRKFLISGFDNVFPRGELKPIHAQSGVTPVVEGEVLDDFIHFFPFGQPKGGVDCRFYLNIKPQHRARLAEALQTSCFNNRIRVYCKFWTGRSRNDGFLIYTNYNQAEEMLAILDQIKEQEPELFEGSEKNNPLLGTINGYVGFGEEPTYKHASFNGERGDAMDEFFNDVISNIYRSIGNFSGQLQTSTGQVIDMQGYLQYRVERAFREHLDRKQQDIKNGIYPAYVQPADYHRYIRAENAIYRACQGALPEYITAQFSTQASQMLEALKNGERPRIRDIIIKTTGSDFTYGYTNKHVQDRVNQLGYFDYRERLSYDIASKLFDVFDVESKLKDYITEETIKPYFDKHHVSVKNPHLNLESEPKEEDVKIWN